MNILIAIELYASHPPATTQSGGHFSLFFFNFNSSIVNTQGYTTFQYLFSDSAVYPFTQCSSRLSMNYALGNGGGSNTGILVKGCKSSVIKQIYSRDLRYTMVAIDDNTVYLKSAKKVDLKCYHHHQKKRHKQMRR